MREHDRIAVSAAAISVESDAVLEGSTMDPTGRHRLGRGESSGLRRSLATLHACSHRISANLPLTPVARGVTGPSGTTAARVVLNWFTDAPIQIAVSYGPRSGAEVSSR